MKSSRRRVRWAVIGAGNIAQVAMLPAFRHARKSAELVAIVSSDSKKRRLLSQKYNVPFVGTYETMETLLRGSGAEAVYIATPNELHREHTERALAAGMHVLCEKPMAMTSADCRAMARAARRHRRKLMIAYRLHFEAATLRALELVQQGTLGDVRYFSAVYSHQVREGDIRTKAQLGGGALFDVGPYPVNAMRHLFRAEPIEVFAFKTSKVDTRSKNVDEMISAMLQFPHDRAAQFIVSQGAADVASWRIVGTKGDLRLEPGFSHSGPLTHHLALKGRNTEKTFPHRDQFAPELIAFSSCIVNDTEPVATAEEGLADVRVLEAIAKSAKTGRAVKLPPVADRRHPTMRHEIRRPPSRHVKPVNAPSPKQ